MKLFKHGLGAAGLSLAALLVTAATASAVTVTPPGPVTGTTPAGGAVFTVNSSGASVSCDSTASGTIPSGSGSTVTIPLGSQSFTNCSTSFGTGASVSETDGTWSIVATDSAGNGYVSIGATTVDTGICSINVSAQNVTGSVNDATDVLNVNDTSVSFTSSGWGCFFAGVPGSGTATFTGSYALDVDVDVS